MHEKEFNDLRQRVLLQQQQIDALGRQLRVLGEAAQQRMTSSHEMAPKRWTDMSTEEQAETRPKLRKWVDWLRNRYALDPKTLPWCWDQHGAATEELSALWTAWQASFAPDAEPGAPANWHDALARTLPRLRAWSARTGCRPGDHHDDLAPDSAHSTPPVG